MTFFRCRANYDITGRKFTLNRCTVGKVMSIQSAEVGFDPQFNSDVSPPTCSWQTAVCRESVITHADITNCNGQRICTIRQILFKYPHGGLTELCPQHEEGNYINIKYNCITGENRFIRRYYTIYIKCAFNLPKKVSFSCYILYKYSLFLHKHQNA